MDVGCCCFVCLLGGFFEGGGVWSASLQGH